MMLSHFDHIWAFLFVVCEDTAECFNDTFELHVVCLIWLYVQVPLSILC